MSENFKRPWIMIAAGCLVASLLACGVLICLALGGAVWFLNGFPFHRDLSPRPALVFSPATLPAATVGEPYEAIISVSENVTPTGEFYLSKDDQLPPGLALGEVNQQESSVTISGTPTEAGTYTFTVNVWCYGTNVSGQQGSMEYTITVNP